MVFGGNEGVGPLRFESNRPKEIDIRQKMPEISQKGFIKSKREGDTGVGYTLEEELGIAENNKRIQDLIFLGNAVELKAQRKSTISPVTLFSAEPKKGILDDKVILSRYGYNDEKGRRSLYVTLNAVSENPQGLKLQPEDSENKLYVSHTRDGRLWFWDTDTLKKAKIDRLLLVFADSKRINNSEHFHYNEAYYLSDFNIDKFFELIKKGDVVVDFRMHLKPSGAVRNHGTAIRGKFKDLKVCYDSKESLIKSPQSKLSP